MIPRAKELADVSRLRDGTLQSVPFAVLLHALATAERTAVIELRRGPLEKHIFFEDGVPVDCRSNLLHETLGKFLVQRQKLSEADHQRALTESASSGAPIGDVLTRLQLISSYDLFRSLQQNLAHKLLDPFTWDDAQFRIRGNVPQTDSALKVNVPQLILTGTLRYTPQARIEAAIVALVGRALGVHPHPPINPACLRLPAKHARVLSLLKGRLRIDEVMAQATLSPDEVARLLYVLVLLGIVAPAEELPAPTQSPAPTSLPSSPPTPAPPQPSSSSPIAPPSAAAEASTAAPSAMSAEAVARLQNELSQIYLAHRRLDAFDLLGLPVDANAALIREKYLLWAEKYAPWRYAHEPLAALSEKALDLFLAGAKAYAELTDPEQKSLVLERRRNAAQPKKVRADVYAIKTELLDAEAQFREGKKRMTAGQYAAAAPFLELAANCDPQNGVYQSELIYCRFLDAPSTSKRAMQELADIMRMDPQCSTAALYAAEVALATGDLAGASAAYRRALQLNPQDRRAQDALARLPGTGKKVS